MRIKLLYWDLRFRRVVFEEEINVKDKVISYFFIFIALEMLPTFRLMGKSTPALTRAFRATACRSGVIGSTADAKVTKDLGTAYPIGNL